MEEILLDYLVKADSRGEYRIEREVDSVGTCVYNLVAIQAPSKNGITEPFEEIVFSYQPLIPDLSEDLCLCNSGEDVGFGSPALKLIDGTEISAVFSDNLVGGFDGFVVDWDNDGIKDDVVVPIQDLTGDGVFDWALVVDSDNNGIPDLAVNSPFYVIGSDDFQYILYCRYSEDYTITDKPLAKYSVTEGILAVGFIVGLFGLLQKIFRRKKVTYNGL